MSDFEKLINASDLIEWIIETCPDWCEGSIRSIVDHIDEMPSAQPERPKGKWIWWIDEGDPSRSRMLVCSICGSGRDEVGTYNFCNICGTKMINPRGEQDG